jgi:hypothetical protein
MKLSSLNHFHAPRRAEGRRPHAFTGGGDILIGVALIVVMVLLTHMVSMATDALVHLFGG